VSAARQTAFRGAPDGARQGYRQGCFWWDLRREPFGRPHQPEDHQTPLAGGSYPTDNAANASNGGQATGRKSSFGNHFHRARPQRIGTLSSGCGTLSSSVETLVRQQEAQSQSNVGVSPIVVVDAHRGFIATLQRPSVDLGPARSNGVSVSR